MKASTFPALVALFATFLFVSATPLMEVRTDSVGGIQIEIHDKLTVISGETIMGSAGSHAWGPEVIGAHSSIWIAGIGMPDTPTGASAKTDITMQTFKYEGYNRGPDSAGGPTRIPVHGQCTMTLRDATRQEAPVVFTLDSLAGEKIHQYDPKSKVSFDCTSVYSPGVPA